MTKIEAIRLYRADTGEEVTGKPVPKGVTVKAKVTGVFQASATYWGTLYVAKKPVPTSPSQVVKSFECFKKASPGGSSFTCEKTWTVNYPAGRYYVGFSVLRKIPGAGWYPEARAYIAHDVTEAAPPAPPTPPPPAPPTPPPEAPPPPEKPPAPPELPKFLPSIIGSVSGLIATVGAVVYNELRKIMGW